MQNTENATKQKKSKRGSYHHGDLRAGLVEATRQLVEEKGPDRFSVSDACRAAGVSTAAPYRHFKTREDMLLAVVMDGMDRFHGALRDGAEGRTPGSTEAIVAMGQAHVAFAEREPGVFRLIFGLTQHVGDVEKKREKGMRVYGVLLEHLAIYLGREGVDEVVHARAFPLWSMVHGLAFLVIDQMKDKMDLSLEMRAEMIEVATRKLLTSSAQGPFS